MRAPACLLLLALYSPSTAVAQTAVDPPAGLQLGHYADTAPALRIAQRCPHVSPTTTAVMQLVIGAGTGIVGASAAMMITAFLALGDDNAIPVSIAVASVYPVYALTSAAAVYGTGQARHFEGRFWPTVLGSALGFGSPGATVAYHISDASRRSGVCPSPAAEPPAPAPASPSSGTAPPRAEILLFQFRF